MSEQEENLGRVRARIEPLIIAFAKKVERSHFHAEDLRNYVTARVEVAPSSADRILRLCRQDGLLDYTVINRRQSLYYMHPLPGDQSGFIDAMYALDMIEDAY